jgi:hypothetical protein
MVLFSAKASIGAPLAARIPASKSWGVFMMNALHNRRP